MLKKLISLLLLLFLTQSVLASFDLHQGSAVSDDAVDIIEHYVDAHGLDYSMVHKCQDKNFNNNSTSQSSHTQADDNGFHHHECHGHTSTISFSSHVLDNFQVSPVYTRFSYLLNDYSITLKSPQRPPIV